MSVTQAEVDALKREFKTTNFDGVEHDGIEGTAMRIGFMVARFRAEGMGEAELLDLIELFVRAGDIDRVDLRAARDTLKALHYSPALISLLTRLARKAPPPPAPYCLPGLPW